LDASAEERARRRFLELRKRGKDVEYKDILQDMIKRDQFDSSRPIAPLKPAEDAIIINSDDMNADEVFQRIMGLLNEFHKD
jgi:cytidylate kinase